MRHGLPPLSARAIVRASLMSETDYSLHDRHNSDAALIQLAQGFYQDEIRDHATYLALAANERDPELREVLKRIAATESGHSRFWKSFLEVRGAALPAARTGRARLVLLRLVQKLMNSALLVSVLESGESDASVKYLECLRTAPMTEREKAELRRIVLDELEHEVTFRDKLSKLGLGNVRDYVLGINDGLVEILGAVTGLSAIYAGRPLIVGVSGLVVGVAGAMSMGIGAFVSVRSQRQVNEGVRQRMEILFDVAPARAIDEYQKRLEASGVPAAAAADVAQRIGANRAAIAHLLLPEARENEVRSGLYTGCAYLIGVVFPVLPYFFAPSALIALAWSVLLAGIALATTAGVVSLLSGISLRRKIIEMLTAGFCAAAIAYCFGWAIRAATGIEI